jgi:hypothetical protein
MISIKWERKTINLIIDYIFFFLIKKDDLVKSHGMDGTVIPPWRDRCKTRELACWQAGL